MGFRSLMKFNPIIRKHFTSRSITKSSSPLWSSRIVKSNAALNSELYDDADFKIQRRWHMGHAHHHGDDHSGKEGEKIFRLGLAADIGLTVGKAVTGYISGSTAIIADAAHSLSDVVLSGVALFSFKAARVPKDKEHPYGHGKFETLGALGISGVLLATSGGIAYHAFYILWDILAATAAGAGPSIADQSISHSHDMHGHEHGGHHHEIDMEHPVLALNMVVISIAIKEGLYWITKRAGEKTGSGLMKANAWHHRADAVSSLVALIGVGGSILGLRFLDPLAGMVVSGMIFKAGLVSGYQSVMELVDAAVPSHSLEPYKRTIMEIEGVKGFSRLRGRRAGSSLYLDVDILVDPFTSVSAAHDIGENVCHQLQQSHPEVTEVFIHIEPATSHISPGPNNHQSSNHQFNTATLEQTDIEDNVASILSCNFSEKMTVKRITRHSLQGQVYLEVYVIMPPEILVADAAEIAKDAEEMILDTVPNVSHVSIHLRLGRPMPEL